MTGGACPAKSAREQYEAAQSAWRGPCAVAERDGCSRLHPESEHDYRTCFQRDRDRIVHCSAFRRLDFKTQVFVPHEHDHFRTRMTHTLEVAQIGRNIGRALRLNEDLIEAAALAHDLGHSPFGHAGEAALNELMAGYGGFEHNRQSLRVVDYLEHPYAAFRGLNLTIVTRECVALHNTPYDKPSGGEFPHARPPVEGQVVDLSDEIAYTSADLDDALAAGWINEADLAGLVLWRRAWSAAEADAPDASDIHKRIRSCKAVLAAMADGAVEEAARRIVSMKIDSPNAARTAAAATAAFPADLAVDIRQLREFLMERVYLHKLARRKGRDARRIIAGLFAAYLKNPAALPERYRRRAESDGLQRVACDYIAGMTDRFCIQEHRVLCGK